VIAIAAHIKKLVAKCIKRCAEYLRIKKTVLREHIQFAVSYDRTCEEQLVPCLIADVVHPLALRGPVLFQLVCLVRDYQVSVIFQKFLFEPPCTLVIHDHDLQAFVRQLCQLLLFLCHCSLENGHGIWKISELFEFFFPNTEDGKRSDHQHTVDFAVLVHTACHGDAHYRFACAHFHKKRCSTTFESLIKYTELVAGKDERLFLMVIRGCLDRHHKFDVLTHCSHPAFL
jgi:hypothetical protein